MTENTQPRWADYPEDDGTLPELKFKQNKESSDSKNNNKNNGENLEKTNSKEKRIPIKNSK